MGSQNESDYEFAMRLHRELNGSDHPVIPLPVVNKKKVNNISKKQASKSDDGGNVQVNARVEAPARASHQSSRNRSRSPMQSKTENVTTIDNQQAITIKRERTSPNDYFMPIINTFVDLNNNSEWALVNMESDVQQMFDKLKEQYWKIWLKDVKYTVKWDITGIISDESSFKIFESHKEILLSTSGMVRPRVQLVSVMLHILIHIYLNYGSKGAVKMNFHDQSFRQIMLFLNQTLSTDISTLHKFIQSPEDSSYPTQWYQCTGICQSYKPFHGVIRSAMIPNESCAFWIDHEESCGGQYFKIFQMTRTNNETQQQQHKFVRNVHYMFPKPRQALLKSKDRLKTKIQVRELFDLTDDIAETATVQNLCEVINLDDSEYDDEEPVETLISSSLVTSFKSQKLGIFNQCSFCQVIVGTSRFKSHLDSCRGFQEKVVFKLKGKIAAK